MRQSPMSVWVNMHILPYFLHVRFATYRVKNSDRKKFCARKESPAMSAMTSTSANPGDTRNYAQCHLLPYAVQQIELLFDHLSRRSADRGASELVTLDCAPSG